MMFQPIELYKRVARAIACGLLLLVAGACTPKPSASWKAALSTACYEPAHASGFRICGTPEGKSTVILVKNPWQGANGVEQAYWVQRGNEPVPEGFDGVVVPSDARRVVCMSSSYVSMLDALGVVDRVAGVSGLDLINNPYVHEHRGRIKDVGADMNYEVLLALQPDLVMLYGVDNAQTLLTDKLSELGIPYIYIGEYIEDTPLGKAEWLRVVAELTGRQAVCDSLFQAIVHRYGEARRSVAQVSHRPTVMLNTPWSDAWVMPSNRSYMTALIRDAGGAYIYESQAGTAHRYSTIGLETAYALLHEADYWLNVGSMTTLQELEAMNPHFAGAKAFRRRTVYNNNLRLNKHGGNDFWESSIVRPDTVLRDLIRILHPEVLSGELYYYRQLK